MNHMVSSAIVFTEFVDLRMAVVTSGDTIICFGGLDLIVFEFSIFQALVFKPGLEESSSAAAAEIVGSVGLHVDKIFFTDNGFDDKS